jgi:hypothetical protein
LTTEALMRFVLQPWQLFVLILASWINRQQQDAIEYLLIQKIGSENAVRRVGFCALLHHLLRNSASISTENAK